MKRIISAVLVALLAPMAHGGRLDLDPVIYRPLPSVAAAYSVLIPGTGWYYTAENGGGGVDFMKGTLIMAAVVGGAFGAMSLFRNHNPVLGAAATFGVLAIRFGDVQMVSERAVQLNLSQRQSVEPDL